MIRFSPIVLASAFVILVSSLPGCSLENARLVSAGEISGVVVEAATGKPIADAIVAIRFERNNTGHSGPHCFRSMAVKTDAAGRFLFKSWKQENTRANYAMGEVTAYKPKYSEPSVVYLHQANRSIGPIAWSDTITFPKSDIKLELSAHGGQDEDRMKELGRLVDNFTCRSQAQSDDMILLLAIRDEIVTAPFADRRVQNQYFTASTWIEVVIQSKSPRR